MISSEKSRKWSKEDFIPLVMILMVHGGFNIFLVDKFYTITEGWFQDYANYMLSGQVPYRDFYMFIPPFWPLLMTAIDALTNNSFIAFRIYGIIERLILFAIVYLLLRKQFNSRVTFMALLTGGTVYMTEMTDAFYNYYQTALLTSMVMVFVAIKLYEHFDDHYIKWSILSGVVACLTTFIKHPNGIILFAALIFGIFLTKYHKDRKRSLACVLVQVSSYLGLMLIILGAVAYHGALGPMIHQLFIGASSKGALTDVLFGFLGRIINGVVLINLGCIAILVTLNILHKERICKYFDNGSWQRRLSYTLSAMSVSSVTVFIAALVIYSVTVLPYAASYPWQFSVLLGLTGTVYLLHCMVDIFSEKLISRIGKYTYDAVGNCIVASCSLLLILVLFYIIRHDMGYIAWDIIKFLRTMLNYTVFFAEGILMVYLLFRIIIKKDHRYDPLFLLVLAAWTIMYISGMSYTIENLAMLLSLSLCVAILLSSISVLNMLKNITVYGICLMLILSGFVQRCYIPYWWWGSNNIASVYTATDNYADPHLAGLKGNATSAKSLNEIYYILENNKQKGDTIYTFPNITYFNVMASLPSPTFAKVHYFDVCSDEIASQDAFLLLKYKPTFIIWLDMPERNWAFHETYFRGGKRSGQRDIQKAYDVLTRSGDYSLLWKGRIEQSDMVYIWALNDGRFYNSNYISDVR